MCVLTIDHVGKLNVNCLMIYFVHFFQLSVCIEIKPIMFYPQCKLYTLRYLPQSVCLSFMYFCFEQIRDCTTTNRSQCSVSPWNECLIRKNIYCFRRHNACISSGRRCYWQSQACSSIGMDGLASRRSFTTSSLK